MVLTRAWVQHWRTSPDDRVVGDAAAGHWLDGASVDDLTARVSGQLIDGGVRAGDRVLFSCAPSVETVLCYIAILRLGAVVVPANTAYTSRELAHVIGDSAPVLAVIDSPERIADLGTTGVTAQALVTSARSAAQPSLELLDPRHDGPAMIAYTSGTTGVPKGALLTSSNLLAGSQALVKAWQWTPDDVLLHALPMFHMHGLGAGLNGTFTAGAAVAVMPRFDVQQIADALTRQPATLFFGVPTMYARFAEQGQLRVLHGLRLLVSGSAPLDPLLFNRITAEAGQSPLERYGMSETVMLTSNPLSGERKAGSVGVPLPDVDVRLGADQGVEVRGPNVFTGYWNLPGVASFTDDGWFRTGDIGRFDEEGYLYLVGRASDLIITGGYNVYPREVEDAIRELPGIDDVAVVGLPDDTWGELVVAFYVSARPEGVDSDEAISALESSLAAYKRPRRWIQMNELPRNAMGKVRRDVLREQG
jgi:malonyl-CoA/methylmalonyl-CoA synthetase